MDGSMVARGGPRYVVESQSPSAQRYVVQQEPKRAVVGGAYVRPQPQRYLTVPPTTRLIPQQTQSPTTPVASGMSLKRPFTSDYQMDFIQTQRFARSADKSKGLRHFSTKVCEKVKEKGRTNYNEVADELVAEYFDSLSMPAATDSDKQSYDMKNIRRRVYDALNVLMAMNIIEKEKKEIRWVGLPTSSVQECRRLEEEKLKRSERIKEKTENLYDLIMQLVAYKSLVERNRERERNEGRPADTSILYLPYVVVYTDKRTMVECNISSDKSEYLFNFDHPFEIQDDIEVLKRLGLAQGLDTGDVSEELKPKIRGCLPQALKGYVDPIIESSLASRMHSTYAYPAKRAVVTAQQPRTVMRPIGQTPQHHQGQQHHHHQPQHQQHIQPRGAMPQHVQASMGAPGGGAPRYIARSVQSGVHTRYVQQNAVVRSQTPHQTERYAYASQLSNGGQKYVVRQMYGAGAQSAPAHHQAQYVEEMYEDEGDEVEYEA